MKPTISIVIPIFNIGFEIIRTLKSLEKQSDNNFEVIIVDDGSTDSTVKIINNYLSDFRLNNVLVINKTNGGVSSARNVGILKAQGDYIYFLDGDDYISPDMIQTVKQQIIKKNSDIITWGFNKVDENGKILLAYFDKYDKIYEGFIGTEFLRRILFEKNLWVWTGSAIYKREFLKHNQLLYTEGCASGEDLEFIYKGLSQTRDISFINHVLSYYVIRKGSVMNSYNIRKFDSVEAIQRTMLYFKSQSTEELKPIIEHLSNKVMIDTFIYTLKSNLTNSNINNIRNMFAELDTKYPSLLYSIQKKAKDYKTKSFKNNVSIKLFFISPIIYSYIYFFLKILNKRIEAIKN